MPRRRRRRPALPRPAAHVQHPHCRNGSEHPRADAPHGSLLCGRRAPLPARNEGARRRDRSRARPDHPGRDVMRQRRRRGEGVPPDAAVIVRANRLDPDELRIDAQRNFDVYGFYGISVFAGSGEQTWMTIAREKFAEAQWIVLLHRRRPRRSRPGALGHGRRPALRHRARGTPRTAPAYPRDTASRASEPVLPKERGMSTPLHRSAGRPQRRGRRRAELVAAPRRPRGRARSCRGRSWLPASPASGRSSASSRSTTTAWSTSSASPTTTPTPAQCSPPLETTESGPFEPGAPASSIRVGCSDPTRRSERRWRSRVRSRSARSAQHKCRSGSR